MLLSEHVSCVAVTFKMTEWVEQQICNKFCVKLECYSTETIQMIQKTTPMGNWWLAASSRQHIRSCITSCAKLFGKTSNHPGDSATLQPRFGAVWFLAFPKTKIVFERGEISDHRWDSKKYSGTAEGDRENCVRPPSAYLDGNWGVIVLCTVFLESCIFFNKCLYFSLYVARYFLDRPCCMISKWLIDQIRLLMSG